MARPRAFDADVVLAAARDCFWAHGYHATSLDELVRVTGVNKPSLYAAFGDKSEFFGRVLTEYHSALLTRSEALLQGTGSAPHVVREWMLSYLPFCSGRSGRAGCLSVNTSIEVGERDEALRDSIENFQNHMVALLSMTLRGGVDRGELAQPIDVAVAARALLAAQLGFMVLARGEPAEVETRRAMQRVVAGILGP